MRLGKDVLKFFAPSLIERHNSNKELLDKRDALRDSLALLQLVHKPKMRKKFPS